MATDVEFRRRECLRAVAGAHHFVFGSLLPCSYPQGMSPTRSRRLIAAATALLFVLSIVGHGFAVAAMAGEARMVTPGPSSDTAMTVPMPSPAMAMQDGGMDCGGTDCSNDAGMHMACVAHCAALMGILAEPVSLPMAFGVQTVPLAPADVLASVHGPPD